MSRRVRLVSAARHIYDGQPIHSGQEFEAEEQDAADLIALHFAVPASGALTKVIEQMQELITKPTRRTYRRRDMKAEE